MPIFIILEFDGLYWSYRTLDAKGALVNTGTGYDCSDLALTQAKIFYIGREPFSESEVIHSHQPEKGKLNGT